MGEDLSSESGPVVLIVEDEPSVSRVLGFWLKQEGFTDYIAASAEEALDLVALVEPALVITDNLLPGMSGVELVRRIKAKRDIPVLLMSGHPEPRRHEADAFFRKPRDFDALIDLLDHLKPGLIAAQTTGERVPR